MAKQHLLRGAFANVAVFNPTTGKKQRFDVGAARTDGVYLPYFTSLSIRTGLAANADVAVQLAPPTWQSYIELIEGPWVRLGNTLSVRWGYTDNPSAVSPWFHTMMLKPEISIDTSYAVTLIGTGFDFSLKRSGAQRVWASDDKPMSVMEVIQEIAARYGMPVVVNANVPATTEGAKQVSQLGTEPIHPLPKEVHEGLYGKRTSIVQSGVNDWAFLRRLVNQIGCWFWIERGYVVNVYYGSSPPKPKSRFVMFGPGSLREGVYPMWNFQTDYGALFLPGRGVAVTQVGRSAPTDTRVQKFSELAFDAARLIGPPVERAAARAIASSTGSGLTVFRGEDGAPARPVDLAADPDVGVKPMVALDDGAHEFVPTASGDEIAELLARGRSDLNAQALGLRCEWDSYDDPSLGPGDLVTAENLGRPFSGNYRVLEIEHKIGGDFGTMHLKVGQLGWLPDYEHPELLEAAGDAREDAPDPAQGEEKQADAGAGA